MDTVIFLSFAFLFCMILMGINRFLIYLDSKKDYSGKKFCHFVEPIDGTDCLLVPYFTWQKRKLEEIKKQYKEEFDYEGRTYVLGAGHPGYRFPKGDNKNYPFIIYYMASLTPKVRCAPIFAPNINIQNKDGLVVFNSAVYINEFKPTVEKILLSLDKIQSAPRETVIAVKDDLETVLEQMESAVPKKARVKKALENIKRFASEFVLSLSVELATGAVTKADWATVIEKISTFLEAI